MAVDWGALSLDEIRGAGWEGEVADERSRSREGSRVQQRRERGEERGEKREARCWRQYGKTSAPTERAGDLNRAAYRTVERRGCW